MNEQLYERLMQLPPENLISLMMMALDEMQAYNGRSRTHCIMTAIGAENVDENTWRVPPVEKIKENTKGFL